MLLFITNIILIFLALSSVTALVTRLLYRLEISTLRIVITSAICTALITTLFLL